MRYIIREKRLWLGEDTEILDEHGQTRYRVDGKIFTIHNTLIIRDSTGIEAATVREQFLALQRTYEITREGEELAQVRKHLLTFLGDRFTVDVPGPNDLEVKGNLIEHEYTMTRSGQLVASISKRWVTLKDAYGVEIAPDQDDVLILASVLVLDLAEHQEHPS